MSWEGAWPSLHVQQLPNSLSQVRALVHQPADGQSDDVTRALARFLVVRACGYLEQVVVESVVAFMLSKSHRGVASYGGSWLKGGYNPKPGRLVDLVRRFDAEWADELKAFLDEDDELLQREIAFLVDRRNKIAHGLSETVSTTKSLDLCTNAEHVADWFLERFDPR